MHVNILHSSEVFVCITFSSESYHILNIYLIFDLCVCVFYGIAWKTVGTRRGYQRFWGWYSQAARCRSSVLSHCYCLQEPCLISKLSPEKSTISLHGNNLVLSTISKDVWFHSSSQKMWGFNKRSETYLQLLTILSLNSNLATKTFHSFKNFYHFASQVNKS